MDRRGFFYRSLLGLATLTGSTRLATAEAAAPKEPTSIESDAAVEAYFLDPGEMDIDEAPDLEAYIASRGEELTSGQKTRSSGSARPSPKAPNFSLFKWEPENGEFLTPLSVKRTLSAAQGYAVNGQILGFRLASNRWRGRRNKGTLTIELRGRANQEPRTWLFTQMFEAIAGNPNLGAEFLMSRDGVASDMITDEGGLDLRVQLLREKSGIIRLQSILAFLADALAGGKSGAVTALIPAVRIPAMLKEGVALSRALLAKTGKQELIWRSAYNPYRIASAGSSSRLNLAPGLWVIVDESLTEKTTLNGCELTDIGGRYALTCGGTVVDANCLIFSLEIKPVDLATVERSAVPRAVPRAG
ncbi:MAG: hypothetical protein AAF513_00825 [Pseudomonadota bacterium]